MQDPTTSQRPVRIWMRGEAHSRRQQNSPVQSTLAIPLAATAFPSSLSAKITLGMITAAKASLPVAFPLPLPRRQPHAVHELFPEDNLHRLRSAAPLRVLIRLAENARLTDPSDFVFRRMLSLRCAIFL